MRFKDTSVLHTIITGFLDHLIVDAGLAQLTVESYGSDLKGFADFLARKNVADPEDIGREDILTFLAMMAARGYSPRDPRQKNFLYQILFQVLCGTGMLKEDPTLHLDTPRLPKNIP